MEIFLKNWKNEFAWSENYLAEIAFKDLRLPNLKCWKKNCNYEKINLYPIKTKLQNSQIVLGIR